MKKSYLGEIFLKPKQKLYVVDKKTLEQMKNTYMFRWVSYKVKQLSPKTPRQEDVRLVRDFPAVVVRPRAPPRGGGTTTRGEKGSRPLSHASARVSDREVSLPSHPRGMPGDAQAAPAPCGDPFR